MLLQICGACRSWFEEAVAKAAGHPLHQQLVVLPLGLLATAVVFDVLGLLTDVEGFATASSHMMPAGVLSGLLAALFGVIDHLAIPAGTRARRVGAAHGLGTVVVVVLFAVSRLLRLDEPGHAPSTVAFPPVWSGRSWQPSPAGSVASSSTGWAWAWRRTPNWTRRRPSRRASASTARRPGSAEAGAPRGRTTRRSPTGPSRAYAEGVGSPPRGGALVLRLLGLLLVVWLVLTIVGAVVKGLFWLAVVGLLLFAGTAVLGWNKRGTRV